MNKSFRKQRGEGETGLLFMVLGLTIAISVGYFAIGFIQDVKAKRATYGQKKDSGPPPKTVEEMGSYEVTY